MAYHRNSHRLCCSPFSLETITQSARRQAHIFHWPQSSSHQTKFKPKLFSFMSTNISMKRGEFCHKLDVLSIWFDIYPTSRIREKENNSEPRGNGFSFPSGHASPTHKTYKLFAKYINAVTH